MATKAKATVTKTASQTEAAAWPFPSGGNRVPAKTKAKAAATGTTSKKFEVTASLKNAELAKSGSALTLEIRDDGAMLGTIEIGAGSILWTAANKKKGTRVGWKRLAELLNQLPK